ncbi:hypothetical protein CULT_2050006 [[Clostridium] ultunense Esp]|nr:hypothetical protein CULT_2050006 [[Clostridium] ultunense Esp]
MIETLSPGKRGRRFLGFFIRMKGFWGFFVSGNNVDIEECQQTRADLIKRRGVPEGRERRIPVPIRRSRKRL